MRTLTTASVIVGLPMILGVLPLVLFGAVIRLIAG